MYTMKSLKQFIEDECLFSPIRHGDGYLSYIASLDEELIEMLWPDGDCPEWIIKKVITIGESVDVVLENLNSHDWTKLKKFFEREYDVRVYKQNDNEDKKDGIQIVCKNVDDAKYIIEDPKFNNCLDFYNYYFSQRIINVLMVEPLYSEKVSISTSNDNYAQAYHVTTREQADSILKTGLRPKKGNPKSYRYFPSRVYLILPDKYSEGIDRIRQALKDLKLIDKDYAVLKISLNRIEHYNFYKDVAMENNQHNNYIYTYAKIPPEDIKDITKKIKNKL